MFLNCCRHLFVALGWISAIFLSSCKDATPQKTEPSETQQSKPIDALSQQVEVLTGAPTKAVWSHHIGTGTPDPFCNGASHQLQGLDTQDGKGVRTLLSQKGNYSRPLITPDGKSILYTRKTVTRPKENEATKIFDLTIMVTDWQGSQPTVLAPGYALDVWKDPATSQVWVYAAQDAPPTTVISWAAKKLVRFRLDSPHDIELVWDKTLISPDNTQLSADGKRASGQAPWPQGGQYLLDASVKSFHVSGTGCWTALAPDNSYLSWTFDANHRTATLYCPTTQPDSWTLNFGNIPNLNAGDVYHPRWTNHAQFITLTGPYLAGSDGDGSIISKGGRSAEIVIAKLNDSATGFVNAVTLTQNKEADAYPDVWISGGETAFLTAFNQASNASVGSAANDDLSQKVEKLTRQHTRAVWSHHIGSGKPDAFSNGGNHQLKGLDTRDGKGLRIILSKKDNYSRPLISPDGQSILYTRKEVKRQTANSDVKVFDMTIMATDWQGSQPRELASGYAVDVWQATKADPVWVYAVKDVPPTYRTSWAAKKLIRFPLDAPNQIETVWEQTEISPDNTQLSADGHRASGQAPWPHGGQYLLGPKSTSFLPTVSGCWASMAPDNSYISWMLDGNHRMATLFTASPEKKTWTLKFSDIPGLEKGEIYHPRWSNHAAFITLTGPYIAEHGGEGSIIGKGGRTAEVVIAKLNPTATGFEGSVTLTQDQNTDTYPDVWIAGGEAAILSHFPQGLSAVKNDQAWPTDTNHLAFLWEALGKPNQINLPDGKNLECYVEPEGTALFGPQLNMQLASGTFRPNALAQTQISKALANTPSWTLEATLLPPSLPHAHSALSGSLISLSGRNITLNDGKLTINGTTLDHPPLELPCYLAFRNEGTQVTLLINGTPLPPITIPAQPDATTTQFGGNPLPTGLLGIALHTTALPDTTIQSSHRLWQSRFTKILSQTPPRIRLRAKLVETTGVPTPEGIDPYTRAMIACVYDVEQVLEGTYEAKQILVCHWALMDRKPCSGFPRKVGDLFELLVEPLDLNLHHPELEGQRILDDTTAFDLEKWYDISPPSL